MVASQDGVPVDNTATSETAVPVSTDNLTALSASPTGGHGLGGNGGSGSGVEGKLRRSRFRRVRQKHERRRRLRVIRAYLWEPIWQSNYGLRHWGAT